MPFIGPDPSAKTAGLEGVELVHGDARELPFDDATFYVVALYARGIDLFVNCRDILAAPMLENAGFDVVHREYMVPMLFPTEIVIARRAAPR